MTFWKKYVREKNHLRGKMVMNERYFEHNAEESLRYKEHCKKEISHMMIDLILKDNKIKFTEEFDGARYCRNLTGELYVFSPDEFESIMEEITRDVASDMRHGERSESFRQQSDAFYQQFANHQTGQANQNFWNNRPYQDFDNYFRSHNPEFFYDKPPEPEREAKINLKNYEGLTLDLDPSDFHVISDEEEKRCHSIVPVSPVGMM
jgi:hypothetical protein